MCLTCMMDTWYFGEVMPGFHLIRGRREYFDEAKIKDWGLQVCNDPDIIFETTPYLYNNEDVFYENCEKFRQELYCSPDLGYEIIKAFKQVPCTYRLKRLFVKYGKFGDRYRIMTQLYIYLAEFIQNATPIVDEFPFGENGFKYDYNFDPKLP